MIPNERIRELRVAGGLSQEALAEMVGLTRVQVTKIEGGNPPRRVSSVELRLFADAFDVPTEALLTTSGETMYRTDDEDSPTVRAASEWLDGYIADSLRMQQMDAIGA